MLPFVWDRWPQFFRGRLRVIYEETGQVPCFTRPCRPPWVLPTACRAVLWVD